MFLYNKSGNEGSKMEKFTTKRMTRIALIAAIYTTISLALAPLSFGNIQVRIAEALTILPVLFFDGILGVSVGCFLTNLFGAMLGVNILGFLDVFFGTVATLIAALLSYFLRNKQIKGIPYLSILAPILVNGIVIGLELTYALAPELTWTYFFIFAAEVAVGQTIAVTLLGIPLLNYFKRVLKNESEGK
jgi:Predicted membrane protein